VLYCGLKIVADTSIDIPNRAAFKASEVCEIAQIPSYVLRSWEKEFPGLGAAARPGGPRIYRHADVEQILRIKGLVFSEGLTLAGARRKLEGEPPAEELPDLPTPTAWEEAKARVADARRGLRDVLDLLSAPISPVSPVTEPEAARVEPTPTWPPAKKPAKTAQPENPSHERGSEYQTALPLLETSSEPQRKPRQTRRGAAAARDGEPSKVE
jgi:DNA-binding transcriptional MerR regulator